MDHWNFFNVPSDMKCVTCLQSAYLNVRVNAQTSRRALAHLQRSFYPLGSTSQVSHNASPTYHVVHCYQFICSCYIHILISQINEAGNSCAWNIGTSSMCQDMNVSRRLQSSYPNVQIHAWTRRSGSTRQHLTKKSFWPKTLTSQKSYTTSPTYHIVYRSHFVSSFYISIIALPIGIDLNGSYPSCV